MESLPSTFREIFGGRTGQFCVFFGAVAADGR